MKIFKVISILFASLFCKADIIKCTFTEPFISTVYSMTQSTLTIREITSDDDTVIKNVSFQIKAPGEFELVDRNGKVLQLLKLNYNGTDSMSEETYPFEGIDNTFGITGGCESNFLKAF